MYVYVLRSDVTVNTRHGALLGIYHGLCPLTSGACTIKHIRESVDSLCRDETDAPIT